MLKVQKEVNDSMRSLVIDWVIEVIINNFLVFFAKIFSKKCFKNFKNN